MHAISNTVRDLDLVVLSVKSVNTLVGMVAAATNIQQVNAQSRMSFDYLDR
jgi:hypothetical protein